MWRPDIGGKRASLPCSMRMAGFTQAISANVDQSGNLYFKGREKNVIVTPAGLKIYPEDLEAELRKEPQVRDCVVVGIEVGADDDGNAEPCAVLLLRDASTASDNETSPKSSNAQIRGSRHSSRCAAGWCGAIPIFRARRRKSRSSREFAPQPKRNSALVRPLLPRQRPLASHAASPLAELLARISGQGSGGGRRIRETATQLDRTR